MKSKGKLKKILKIILEIIHTFGIEQKTKKWPQLR